MERRVQLQNLKQKPDDVPEENVSPVKVTDMSPIQSGSNHAVVSSQSEVVLPRVPLASTPTVSTTVKPTPAPSISEPPIIKNEIMNDGVPKKRIKTLLPVRRAQSPTIASPTTPDVKPPNKRRKLDKSREDPENPTTTNFNCESDAILDDLINQAVKEGAIINVTDANVANDHIVAAKVVLEPCPPAAAATAVVTTTNEVATTTCEKEPAKPIKETSPAKQEDSILPEHRRIQQLLAQKSSVVREPNHLKKDLILTTETPYLTHVGECGPNQTESTIQIQPQETQVEV